MSLLGVVGAQVVSYSTRGDFEAAVGFGQLVDFEAGIIGDPASGEVFAGPLTSGTNNGVFSTGDIESGVSFSNSCSAGGYLILAGVGFDLWGWAGSGGFPSKVLIPSNDTCSLSIVFDPAIDAVAMDIYAEGASGYRVLVYGVGDVLLGTVDGTAGMTSPGFFGMSSGDRITRIVMKAPSGSPTGAFEAVDDVIFTVLPLFVDGFESGTTSAWAH